MHKHHYGEARYAATKHITIISAIVNLALGVIKILFGIFGLSSALIADGIHSLGDLLCDGAVFVAAYFSRQDADEDHPYGHNRFETAATLLLSILLVFIAFGIAYAAITHILQGSIPRPNVSTAIVAIISILANEGLFRYMILIAKRHKSKMLKANAWHSRADALSSVVVLVGILGSLAGLTFLDAVAAVLVALLIGKIGIGWFWHAFAEFTEKGLDTEKIKAMRQCIAEVDGVIETHQLRTRTMADKVLLDVHLLIDSRLSASEGHHISENVMLNLSKAFPDLKDVTIHVDVENHPHVVPKKLLPTRNEIRRQLDPIWRQFINLKHIDHILLFYDNYQSIDMRITIKAMNAQTLNELLPKFNDSIAKIAEIKSLQILLRMQ